MNTLFSTVNDNILIEQIFKFLKLSFIFIRISITFIQLLLRTLKLFKFFEAKTPEILIVSIRLFIYMYACQALLYSHLYIIKKCSRCVDRSLFINKKKI